MPLEVVTGNHAAGHSLCAAGEANRLARGAVCGIYPITPQTEIVERVAAFPFTKGRVVPVEREHSAMAVAAGGSLAGARAFTASSSNGLAYMVENVAMAGFYRLPIVMVAVNRTLGPPWNIWADQGDTLMLRDLPWIQLYASSNQEVADLTILAFRLAEDRRVLLPAMVCMDAFILSHTQAETDLPAQEDADRYLPLLDLPHRLRADAPRTLGGLVWPDVTTALHRELDEAMGRVPAVYRECRAAFRERFGRDPGGALDACRVEGARTLLIASGTISTTALRVVEERRAAGEAVGLVRMRALRPFPAESLLAACRTATRVGVLDRDYAAGVGGVWCREVRAAFQGVRDDALVQGYLSGIGGGDVTPAGVDRILNDLLRRKRAGPPVWADVEDGGWAAAEPVPPHAAAAAASGGRDR